MKWVLLIPGWFPNRKNFLAGDFIERHARAASLYFPVKVLFVVKDNDLPFGSIETDHRRVSPQYEAVIVYYSSRSPVRLAEKFASVWMQARCLQRGFRQLASLYGLPSLIHAHVLVKHAWFALRLHQRHHIPLMASEQWTGYLPEAKGEFGSLSRFQRRQIAKIFSAAVHTTTVSEYLAQQLCHRYGPLRYSVVPNLVDTAVFQPLPQRRPGKTRFIHISTLSRQKNFDEILAACRLLATGNLEFELAVVAPAHTGYAREIERLGLRDYVLFRPELPQAALRELVADADALILYSNYETFGCVIVEANACGVPVIVSDHPVFSENVEEGLTGFRVPLHRVESLADSMKKIINKTHSFRKDRIVEITEARYSVEVVGKQFAELYNRYANP